MDCTDMVMASVVVDGDARDDDAKRSYLHIEDMYTRDRSTPLTDAWLDGEQSLTAAFGAQIIVAAGGDGSGAANTRLSQQS